MSIQNDIKMPFRNGNVLIQLIIVNISVFLVLNIIKIALFFSGYSGLALNLVFGSFLENIGMPMNAGSFIYKPWTIFTYMFTHEGVGHIFWNMFSLYFFGGIIQNLIGNSRILAIYIYGGLVGALLTIALHSTVPVLAERSSILIGASGSIMAIVIGSATLVPDKRIFLFIFGEIKLVYIALFFVIIDLIGVTYSDGVGHICHIGGAITGFLFMLMLKNGNDLAKPFNKLFYGSRNVFKPKPKMKIVKNTRTESKPKPKTSNKSVSVQETIDKILDKISKGGYESLSKDEKDYLFRHGKDL